MTAVRARKSPKLVRSLGLMASASIMSILMAGEAQAACVVSPVQPLNNITTPVTTVTCTGANTGQAVAVNTSDVTVRVNNAGSTLDNSTVTMTGDNNVVYVNPGASAANLVFNSNGASSGLSVYGAVTNLTATIAGQDSGIFIINGGTVTAGAGNINLSTATGESQTFFLGTGSITGSTTIPSAYLITGGSGTQEVLIGGTMNVQSNGLAISTGADNDFVTIRASANLAVSGGINTMVFDGGSGNDQFTWEGGAAPITRTANIGGFETGRFTLGAGLLTMRGNATYSDVVIGGAGGTVRFDDIAALGNVTANVFIAGGATAELNQFGNQTLAHNFSGTGTVRQLLGTYTYDGNSTGFSGTFELNGATAILDNSTALGTANIVINSGNLTFGDFTLANSISGTGGINKVGPGIGSLTGDNSGFSGIIDINGGTLLVSNVNALGTGGVQALNSPGTLQLDLATGQILANDLDGDLAILKSGAGVLDITGNNSHTGGTTIDGGAIRVDDFARLGTGAVTANLGTSLILNYNGAAPLLQTAPFMTGDGRFIKEGTGEVIVDTNNTYSGGTTIAGGALRWSGITPLGTGDIVINSGGTLALGATGFTPFVSNNISGNGSILLDRNNGAELYGNNTGFTGNIDLTVSGAYVAVENGAALGNGTVNLSVAGTELQFDIAADTTSFAGLTGVGTIIKSDTGTLTLAGVGSMTGGSVEVDEGTLRLSGTGNLGAGPVINLNDATAVLDLNTNGSTILSNNVAGIGRLIKTGTGTGLVTGTNSYTGGTDIQQGAIRVTNTSFLGTGPITVQQGAALDLSIAGSQTLSQNVTGAGILRKSNVGDLTLLSNGLTGGVDIVGGRVLVGTSGALGGGPVSMAADTQLVFTNATNEVISNSISGAGTLTMNGTGTLTIQNANSYTGGTLINTGRIELTNAQGLGTGNVIVLSGAILGIGNINLANTISGAGRIIKTGSGAATLTGTNTLTGGIEIQAGSIGVTGNSALGTGTITIGSGAALNYANSGAATFSNALSGAGTFNKLGTGQLTFANNFGIGNLALSAGRTRINTVGTTNVTVASGATLDGTGRIIGNLTNSGTVAPGNSIGTLTVQGNYIHNPNSILEIEFDAAGNIDLLAVTGNATINGGTLRFISIGNAEGQGGTFLTTGGTLTGTFATVETVGALLPLAVIYEPNRAFMAPSVLTARPSTFNAQSLAAADTALGFIDSMEAGDIRRGKGSRIWLNGFGAWGSRSASGSTLAYDHDTHGLAGGVNIDASDSLTLGVAVGWAKGDITLGSNGGGGDQSSVLGGLILRYAGSGFTLGTGLFYGNVDQDTVRNVSFNGFSASVSGSTSSKLFGGFAELDLPLGSSGGWKFDATARGSYVRQSQDAYTESGTSPLRLSVGELNTTTLEGQAKLTATTKLWAPETFAEDHEQGLDLRIDLGTRYVGTLGDRFIPVTFAASTAGVVLQGDTRNSLQGEFGLGLQYTARSGATISLGYRGEVGNTDRHTFQAGVSFAF